MREIVIEFDPERKLFLYLGLILVTVVLGPFGTYDSLTLWPRVTFWALDIMGTAIILSVTLHVFFHSQITAQIRPLNRFFLAILIGSVPASAFVALICDTVGASLSLNLPLPVVYLQIVGLAVIVFSVEFVVWPKILRPNRYKPHAEGRTSVPKNTLIDMPPKPQSSSLIQRLPPDMQDAEILSISMQDHYAQIVTSKGEHLLLIRLSDAIDLLDGQPGLQIHRSHWVATSALKNLTRNGRRHDLHTTDGRTLPVSAARISDVKDMLASAA